MVLSHFPLASLCIEDAEHYLGAIVKQHSRADIISAMQHVASHIVLDDTLAMAWDMVNERLEQ